MPALPPSETRRLDVEAALGAAGFTPFHRRAVAITGIAWTFVAMEILLIGFTLPLFGSIWDLSGTDGRPNAEQLLEHLRNFAEEGWELVSLSFNIELVRHGPSHLLVFKRAGG